MARKDARVVVSGRYLALLQEKAEMLDAIFHGAGSAIVTQTDFKKVREFEKRFDKVDTGEIDYVEPKEA
jgi:hypothetical protein